ncbi:MAG: copper amine oxidase N-terminal domain-containing protein [Syntrophomonadaceae bacterium]
MKVSGSEGVRRIMQAAKRWAVAWTLILTMAGLVSWWYFVPRSAAAAVPNPGAINDRSAQASDGLPVVISWEPATGEGYAILYGTLDDEGASEVEHYGFYVGSPGYEDKEIKIEFDGRLRQHDTFRYRLAGLDDGVVYYVKAFAANDQGYGYGDRLYFEVDKSPQVSVFTVGSPQYTLSGTPREMDVAPYIKDSRTYMPIRYAAYAMGLTDTAIVWDEANRTVILSKGGRTVKLVVGSYNMWVNGIPVPMDVLPEITQGRVFLPIAWVAKAFGQIAIWDGSTSTITIQLR